MKLQGAAAMAAAVVVVLLSCSIAVSAEYARYFLEVSHAGVPSPAPAPAPLPPPVNITAVIQNAGQFSTFLRLIKSTGVDVMFQSIANDTHGSGVTIFAPTDTAFAALRRGALDQLSTQQTLNLVQYHGLSSFFPLSALQQPASPVFATMVPGSNTAGGQYTLNVTNMLGTVLIETGFDTATLVSTLYNANPCAIFAIDKVLLPEAIFGLPSPAPSPSPFLAPGHSPASSASPSTQVSAESPLGHSNQALSLVGSFPVLSMALGILSGFYLM